VRRVVTHQCTLFDMPHNALGKCRHGSTAPGIGRGHKQASDGGSKAIWVGPAQARDGPLAWMVCAADPTDIAQRLVVRKSSTTWEKYKYDETCDRR
jgi:hypothetical protein